MIDKVEFSNLRGDIDSVRREIESMLFAVCDATKPKPEVSPGDNCTSAARAAANAFTLLEEITRKVDAIEQAPAAPRSDAIEFQTVLSDMDRAVVKDCREHVQRALPKFMFVAGMVRDGAISPAVEDVTAPCVDLALAVEWLGKFLEHAQHEPEQTHDSNGAALAAGGMQPVTEPESEATHG